MSYVTPTVSDLGTIVDLTQAVAIIGTEDGASKLDSAQHHEVLPSLPALP